MNRRHFLKSLPGLGYILFDIKSAFARTFPNFFPEERRDELSVYRAGSSYGKRIPIRWQSDVVYVSAFDLAEALNYQTYFNHEKKKLVIYLPNNRVVIASDNPFVLIDSKPLQMPLPALWKSNEIYIPLLYLVTLINQFSNLSLTYNENLQELRIGRERFNVAGVDIDAKKNGVVIRIRTSRRFKDGEISMDTRFDWLHVDLYGGTGDVDLITRTPRTGHVREVKAFQFKDILSIAFRLRPQPVSKNIYQEKNTNEVVVILRYQEDLAETDIKEAEQEVPVEDEVQKQLEQERKRWLIDTVVIDAGHGGQDPGAIGHKKVREKDITLAVALKLGDLIERNMPGVRVVYTRKDDQFIELRRRTQIANENNAKIFISIHANSNRSKHASGFETYILGQEKGEMAREVAQKENSVIQFESPGSQQHYEGINRILVGMAHSAFMKQSEHLAEKVQEDMNRRLRSLNMNNRGVKQAHFWVMVGASMPSILVEIGFLTNSYDARILRTAAYQQQIAEGIFHGLQKFKKDHESSI
jgi:N-acetylmuramoyl-L-alanine amidase